MTRCSVSQGSCGIQSGFGHSQNSRIKRVPCFSHQSDIYRIPGPEAGMRISLPRLYLLQVFIVLTAQDGKSVGIYGLEDNLKASDRGTMVLPIRSINVFGCIVEVYYRQSSTTWQVHLNWI